MTIYRSNENNMVCAVAILQHGKSTGRLSTGDVHITIIDSKARHSGRLVLNEPVALRALRLQVAQGIYDLPLARCERIAAALEALLALPPGPRGDVSALEAEPLNPTLATLRKILSNIVSSVLASYIARLADAEDDKQSFRGFSAWLFLARRTLKPHALDLVIVWDVELGKRVLLECGFVQTEEAVTLAQEAALGPVRFIVSRLQEAGECIRNTAPIDIRGDGAEGAQWEQAGNAHMQGAGQVESSLEVEDVDMVLCVADLITAIFCDAIGSAVAERDTLLQAL
eukprot:gene539-929_t